MRTDIPAGLQTHLETRETTLAWCWKITLTDGTVLGFTNHDRPLTFASTTFEASTGFLGSEIESSLGMSVDNMGVHGAVDSEIITETDIAAGLYDNAEVVVYLVNWSDVSQYVVMKQGNLGEVKRGEVMFETEVRGISNKLQNTKGEVYEYACTALLGDGRCGKTLSGSEYRGSGAVTSTDGYTSAIVSGLDSYDNSWFSRGKLSFTSGANNGISREVRVHVNASGVVTLSLWERTPFEIDPSDTFSVTAGCDKAFKTCKAKFDNAVNFRGFPHVPGTDTLMSYASPGDPNFDGGGNFAGKD